MAAWWLNTGAASVEPPAPACPHCHAAGGVRSGQANGLQRYKCRGCGKTFNALSCTPMARLRHKDKWRAKAQVLGQGLSVHEAAGSLDSAPQGAGRVGGAASLLPVGVRRPMTSGKRVHGPWHIRNVNAR